MKDNELTYYVESEISYIGIDEETLRGLFLIMSGLPFSFHGSELENRDKAISLMKKAHKLILKIGKEKGFDMRGSDL